MSERRPTALARAEHATRRTTLVIGAGFVAFVAGTLATAWLAAWVSGPLREVTSDAVILLTTVSIQSVWVLVFLPLTGWLTGRFLDVSPTRFTVVAGGTGLVFDVLLTLAAFGAEWLVIDLAEAVARVAFLLAGGALSFFAVTRGAAAFAKAQAASKALSAGQRAEYQAFANQTPSPPDASAPPGGPPKAE